MALKMNCVLNVLMCLLMAIMFVGSLYIWRNTFGRDHPSTIKKRFISVFLMTFISASLAYIFYDDGYFNLGHSFWAVLGVRREGLLNAIVLPLFLTMVLFLGPLTLQYGNGGYRKALDFRIWRYCLHDVAWLRNHIVAPFAEEFTFRACMLPLLVPCFGNKMSVIFCPFFFGIAHLHHLREKLFRGEKLKEAALQSLFQFAYTTIFGAYSTYLFLRTGHFLAPFVAHAFCNHLGFPEFGQLLGLRQPKKTAVMVCFAVGLLGWALLLKPLTEPNIYNNSIYAPTFLHSESTKII